MKKMLSFLIFSFIIVLSSCDFGLGAVVDLEAPVIELESMTSGGTVVPSSDFAGGIYCNKLVNFKGLVSDNVKIKSVYTEIKWSNETEFSYFSPLKIDNGKFDIDINLGKEGTAFLRFVVTDQAGNEGIKSSRVLTLLVDDTAPVGEAWYINRRINGIQYNLRDLEDLKEIVKNPYFPENKDAFQNNEISIHSSFNDSMGIAENSISIVIRDEEKNKVIELKNTANSLYSPEFVFSINDENLPEKYKTGCHFLQVYYNAADVVLTPNKVDNQEVESGWFIWWPESDIPKITSNPSVDPDTNQININVKETVTLTVFDDDALSEIYCALLTENEKDALSENWLEDPVSIIDVVPLDERASRTKLYSSSGTERDTVIPLTSLSNPQIMYLYSYVKESNGKENYLVETINVSDASSPILFISSPNNNTIPSVQMNNDTEALVNIQGVTLDTSGCTYLEFVWVPESVDSLNPYSKAKDFLDKLSSVSEHNKYAPNNLQDVKVSNIDDLGYLWSVKLGEEEDSGNGFKRQRFNLTLDLLNDFVFEEKNEKNERKYFLIKLTRKDGKFTYQEYILKKDESLPKIRLVNPKGDMDILDCNNDLEIKFEGTKENNLAMDVSSYKIELINSDKNNSEYSFTSSSYDESDGLYKALVSSEVLSKMFAEGLKPKYRFSVTDIFGNSVATEYTFVISDNPQLETISSTTSSKCKAGDVIEINANFTNTVILKDGDTSLPYIKINGIKNNGLDKDVKAYYSEGSGSTTLIFTYTVETGDYTEDYIYLDANPVSHNENESLKEGVHLDTLLPNSNLQDKKQIRIDAVIPKITDIQVRHDADPENEFEGLTYLREGRYVEVELTIDKNVSVQGTPKFNFNDELYLPFTSVKNYGDETRLIFNKKIENSDNVIHLIYNKSSCVENYDVIKDEFGNSISLGENINVDPKLLIDCIVPETPVIIDNSTSNELIGGKKKEKVVFALKDLSDNTIKTKEYSTDSGSTWKDYTGAVTLFDSVQLTARYTDYAGNVSNYSSIINLDINNSFPTFSLECTNADGYYKINDVLIFKVLFAENVVFTGTDSYIALPDGRKAIFDSTGSRASEDGVLVATYKYTIKNGDEFKISVAKDGVKLTGVKDLYGFEQGEKTLSSSYEREIYCDSVAPVVNSMTPNNGTVSATNVYKNGNVVQIKFSEPVQKGSGNLILRQTANWAIPPVLTAEEYSTIASKLSYADKNTIARQDANGKFAEDMEDTAVGIKHRNNQYHGTGQFIGPYKKSMQGVKLDNGYYVPDISTKFVLDFDIGIWETTEKHPIGKTFKAHTDNNADPNYVTPTETITAGEIRSALEKSGMHQRVLDVTSASVKIDSSDKSIVIVTFPAGLIDKTDDLPDGRKWELVVEKGAFLDISGNEFGYGLTNDAIQSSGLQSNVSNSWKRGRESITDGSKPVVLLKTNGNEYFESDKVATPVVRVDRYSYGLGIKQADSAGNRTISIGTKTKNVLDDVIPTAYARVRIDCETESAEIKYGVNSSTKGNGDLPGSNTTEHFENTGAKTWYSTTDITAPQNYNNVYNSTFALGSGSYKTSYKGIVGTKATRENFEDSSVGLEGVFQTVIYFSKPVDGDGGAICDQKDGIQTDLSIRGTTGLAGEPSISPFPLRDSRVGSPYLRIVFREETNTKNSKDYYWISYEILVMSSFSNYVHASNDNSDTYYDWSRNWGIMYPGEITRVEGMRAWRN